MKKIWILTLVLLLSGCASFSQRVPLFNYDFGSLFGGTPNAITIRKGDTLYSISRKYNVPLREMIEANRLRPPYSLNVGQTLRIPSSKYHIVKKGDTLYNISKRYNVNVNSLSNINNLNAPYALNIGQRLALPGSVYADKASTSPAETQKEESSWMPWSNKKSSQKTYRAPPPAPIKKRSSKFAWPLKGKVISQFGTLGKGRTNDGINISAPRGTAVKAADSGTIAYAGNELKGFGNLILIKHNDGWVTAYAHNDRIFVKKGQKITKGEKIANVGSTGGVNSPQLHFEIRAGKKAVNPNQYLQ